MHKTKKQQNLRGKIPNDGLIAHPITKIKLPVNKDPAIALHNLIPLIIHRHAQKNLLPNNVVLPPPIPPINPPPLTRITKTHHLSTARDG